MKFTTPKVKPLPASKAGAGGLPWGMTPPKAPKAPTAKSLPELGKKKFPPKLPKYP